MSIFFLWTTWIFLRPFLNLQGRHIIIIAVQAPNVDGSSRMVHAMGRSLGAHIRFLRVTHCQFGPQHKLVRQV